MSKAPQGRKCSVCQHPSRAAIDQAILNGKAANAIAATFGFTYNGKNGETPNHKIITNHRDRCMPDAYQAAMNESKTGAGARIAARLRVLDEAVDEVLAEAREGYPVMAGDTPMLDEDGKIMRKKDGRMILGAVREARANAEMLAKLAGAVPEEDEAALDRARAGVQDPRVRALVAQAEALLADAEAQ